jgi:hypothetical protein
MQKIAQSFVKAQKAFGPALKSSTNPHFRTKYADLSACVEAVIDALNDNGIALIQQTHECDNGVSVETIFMHESGEMLSTGRLHVPAAKQDPQGYGSALTYARRYSLMAACGIAPEDDDANAASKKFVKPEPKPEPKVEPKVETKIPAHIEGFDTGWQIKVTVTPEANLEDWSEKVTQAAKTGLTFCANKTDVTDLFKVNRNIFDKLKQLDPGTYKLLMEDFSSTKAKFEKGDEA